MKLFIELHVATRVTLVCTNFWPSNGYWFHGSGKISEGVRAGAKAASIACVVSAVPTVCTVYNLFPLWLGVWVFTLLKYEVHFISTLNKLEIYHWHWQAGKIIFPYNSILFMFDFIFGFEYICIETCNLWFWLLSLLKILGRSSCESWFILPIFFSVDCLSYDTMGQGKPQLYCSGTHHIWW